jgi:uncharacterized membrane protein
MDPGYVELGKCATLGFRAPPIGALAHHHMSGQASLDDGYLLLSSAIRTASVYITKTASWLMPTTIDNKLRRNAPSKCLAEPTGVGRGTKRAKERRHPPTKG